MAMHGKKKHRVLSKIIALVIIQGVVLSGIQSAYCGESLRQKIDILSPHINVGVLEIQQAFNITATVLSDSAKGDKRISRRKFIEISAILAAALVISPTLATKSIADTLTKEERKRFEELRKTLRTTKAAEETQASYRLTKLD